MRLSRSRRRRLVLAFGAVAVVLAASGRPAAVRAQQQPGQPAPEPGVCQGCKPPLLYRGGPVLDTSNLTITPIYWAPSGYSFSTSYPAIINQYLADVAADSGKSQNTYAIDSEYYMTSGGTKTSVVYKIDAGPPINATDAFPSTSTPCDVHPPYSACVNQDQIRTELATVLASGNLPADLNHVYLLLFPEGVQTFETNARSQEVYCGIHSAFDLPGGGGTVLYADEPYITSCSAGQAPNGDAAADTEVSIIAHEMSETITDPLSSSPSWFDAAGNEIGDECNFNYGPPLGSTDQNNPQTTEYNQVINGHYYYAQTMFSNASYTSQGIGKGCLTAAYAAATTTAFKAASTTSPASATLDASDTRLPADGKSTSKLTLTVLDESGEPVSGDHIHFDVKSSDQMPGMCGGLSSADGMTDDNGQFATTYTASSDNVACIVFGIDSESGSSDWATVYQGSADSIQPAITDASLPSSITPGGGTETFSVTASNPSNTDIADARLDVFLTGDNNGTTGLKASQVHLAYSDDTTGGAFVAVPTSGETVKDGEIDAYVMPDKAADLPAGGSRTVTFQISIDSGAPDTATTGSPLHVETDLDQFDPADNSQNNLDYVGPVDVTIASAGSSGGGLPLPVIVVIAVVGAAVVALAVVLLSRRRTQAPAG